MLYYIRRMDKTMSVSVYRWIWIVQQLRKVISFVFWLQIFSWIKYTKFSEILFWLTNTLNNIVALFHKVVFVYKDNWIENELASLLWHEEINPSISEVAFFSFDKKMKMFKMRIFTIVPCCFQNIAKSYMTCNLFSRKKFLEYDISP